MNTALSALTKLNSSLNRAVAIASNSLFADFSSNSMVAKIWSFALGLISAKIAVK